MEGSSRHLVDRPRTSPRLRRPMIRLRERSSRRARAAIRPRVRSGAAGSHTRETRCATDDPWQYDA